MIESLIEQARQEAINTISAKLTELATLVSGREDAAEILTNAVRDISQLDQIISRYK